MTRSTLTTDAPRAQVRRLLVELFGLIEFDRPIHVDGGNASVTLAPDDAGLLQAGLRERGHSVIIKDGEYPTPSTDLRPAMEALHARLLADVTETRAALDRMSAAGRGESLDAHYQEGRHRSLVDAARAIETILKGRP